MVEIGFMTGLGAVEAQALAARAEAASLDHLSVGDHVSFFTGIGGDGLIASAQFATVSDRLDVNTGVYLLPLRHPVLVARQLADIDALAPGRFTFGVGIGGEDRHEVEVCGVDPSTRGRRMDESIEIVRALSTGEPLDYHGEFFQLEQARIEPAMSAAMPIVVGGRSDAAIRRAGRLGDGWFGIWVSARRYGEVVEQVREHARDADRGDVPQVNALNVWCGVDDDRDRARSVVAQGMESMYQMPYERFERWSPYGTADDVAEFLVPYVDAGCTIINLITRAPSTQQAIETSGQIREQILAAIDT